jgi:hypothetical protein
MFAKAYDHWFKDTHVVQCFYVYGALFAVACRRLAACFRRSGFGLVVRKMGRPFENVAVAACRDNVSTGADKRLWLLQAFPPSERCDEDGCATRQMREHCPGGLIACDTF